MAPLPGDTKPCVRSEKGARLRSLARHTARHLLIRVRQRVSPQHSAPTARRLYLCLFQANACCVALLIGDNSTLVIVIKMPIYKGQSRLVKTEGSGEAVDYLGWCSRHMLLSGEDVRCLTRFPLTLRASTSYNTGG